MNALATLIYLVGQVLIWMLIIWAVMGWLITFNVINARNPFVQSVMRSLEALFTPLLRPIRRYVPTFGGIDFSPIVLVIIIIVVQTLLLDDLLLHNLLLDDLHRATEVVALTLMDLLTPDTHGPHST